jgi:hypothetical protein
MFFAPVYIGEVGEMQKSQYEYSKSVEFQNQGKIIEKNIIKDRTDSILKKETIATTIVDIILIVLLTVAIFLFGNRSFQLRIVRISIFFSLCYAAFIYYSIFSARTLINNVNDHFLVGSFLPILAMVLLILASRAISKDIKLVRTVDRIR